MKRLTDAELESLLREAPAVIAAAEELLRNPMARFEASWRQLAGPYLDQLRGSRDEAIKGLSNPSEDIRNVAFQLLLKNWKPHADILPQCLRAISNDPDSEVRVRAIYYLSALFRAKSDLPAS